MIDKYIPGLGVALNNFSMGAFGIQTILWGLQGVVNLIPSLVKLFKQVGDQIKWVY